MRPLFLPLVGWLLSVTGCADRPIRTSAGKLTQAQVDQIVEKCGGPSGMATVDGGQLVIQRSKDVFIMGCVLKELQATGETALSAVGNERHDVRKAP